MTSRHRHSGRLALASAITLAASALAGTRSAKFFPLGFLDPPSLSIAFDISADGRTAVGESIGRDGLEAFYWTAAGGMVGIGAFPNEPYRSSQAMAVSANGRVIVGASTRPDALLEDGAPFRWTAQTGIVLIPNLGGDDTGGIAEALTPDGAVIVGWCASPTGYQAFRWTESGGTQSLGLLPDERLSRAVGVSADGWTIVGNVSSGSLTFPRPFVWTPTNGKVILRELNSNTIGSANAVTPNGAVIVGQSAGRAVRWPSWDEVQNLGELSGGDPRGQYWASCVTADGQTVLGVGNFIPSEGAGEAFIWTAAQGMRSLWNVLVGDYGLKNLEGWTLFDARGVTPDGSVICGYGFDPQGYQQAWVVRLRAFRGDLNCDEVIDFGDINPFVLALSDPDRYRRQFPDCDIEAGDCNGDGRVDFGDINPFVELLSGR